jgi:hypothetical protein
VVERWDVRWREATSYELRTMDGAYGGLRRFNDTLDRIIQLHRYVIVH